MPSMRFEDLDGPVVRLSTPDVADPFSAALEQAVLAVSSTA